MGEFKMPALGADMAAGTLLEWRVKPGEEVKRGDIVAVVDTSKAEIEVEIFESGVIDELLVGEGERVPVGTVLATVRAVGDNAGTAPPHRRASPLAAHPDEAHRRASPLAARIAERLGVNLTEVNGSGPGGAIVRADVERAAGTRAEPDTVLGEVSGTIPERSPGTVVGEVSGTAAERPPDTVLREVSGTTAERPPDTVLREVSGTIASASGPRGEEQRLSKHAAMRDAIGSLMARSKREIPHYYLQREIDLTAAIDWLTSHNRPLPPARRLLPAVLLLAAVTQSAREMPEMNGLWADGGFQAASSVDLGVAVSLRGGGLVAPAIRHADELGLDELMAALRDVVSRARAGTLRSSEMSSPSITVTNLGEQGADLVHGVIYPPQVALVGFGSIRERPWASGGMLAARPTVISTLAADHRASDGHAGSRFLAMIERRMLHPEGLMEDVPPTKRERT